MNDESLVNTTAEGNGSVRNGSCFISQKDAAAIELFGKENRCIDQSIAAKAVSGKDRKAAFEKGPKGPFEKGPFQNRRGLLTARGRTAERNTKAAQERESLRRAASMSVLVPQKSAVLIPKRGRFLPEEQTGSRQPAAAR